MKIRTREDFPQDWADTQNSLAFALTDQAQTADGDERARLLTEAVMAMRGALEIHTAESAPDFYKPRAEWIAAREAEIKELEAE